MTKTKPRYSEPCNHCGECCRLSLCHIAENALQLEGPLPCPALTSEGKCMVVEAELASGLAPIISLSLGIGTGCSCPDEDTTKGQMDTFERTARKKLGFVDEYPPVLTTAMTVAEGLEDIRATNRMIALGGEDAEKFYRAGLGRDQRNE